jgi:hypothetical protein
MKRRALTVASGAAAASTALWIPWTGELAAENGPTHVFDRADALLPVPALLWVAGAVAFGMLISGRRTTGDACSATRAVSTVLLAPLALIAIADLVARGGNLAAWTGASYLVPALLPLTIAAACADESSA